MSSLATSLKDKLKNPAADTLRLQIVEHCKTFKTAWLDCGQALFTVYQDKLYHAWGFEKFEDYIATELGLKKSMALKLVKTYAFVEAEEPAYLNVEYREGRPPVTVPGVEQLDVLRLARRRKELTREDYAKLRKEIFEKGKDETTVRKDLTALIRERKPVDPDEERDRRSEISLQKIMQALKIFKKDMETFKLVPQDIIEETEQLLRRIEEEVR